MQGDSTAWPGKQVWLTFNGLKWNAMTNIGNMSDDMTETSVTGFHLANIWSGERIHQCLDPTTP